MEAFKNFFDPSAYSQMEPGTKRAALKKAMKRMFLLKTEEKEDPSSTASTNGSYRSSSRHSSAYSVPFQVDSVNGMSVYEIEAGQNGVSEIGDHTPLKYR